MPVRLSFEGIDGVRGPVFQGDEAGEVGGHVFISRDGATREVAVQRADGNYMIVSGAETGSAWGLYRRADTLSTVAERLPVVRVDQDSMDPAELAAIERRAGLLVAPPSPWHRILRLLRLAS